MRWKQQSDGLEGKEEWKDWRERGEGKAVAQQQQRPGGGEQARERGKFLKNDSLGGEEEWRKRIKKDTPPPQM